MARRSDESVFVTGRARGGIFWTGVVHRELGAVVQHSRLSWGYQVYLVEEKFRVTPTLGRDGVILHML